MLSRLIGRDAVVAAGAVVTRSVEPCTAAGVPARPIRKIPE
jgi:acetyltransferase-like isoleucine patch superfamily enzyme